MSSDELAIQVEDVGKCFEIYRQPQDRLKQFIIPSLYSALRKPAKSYYEPFWALQHISFEVKRRQSVGILGQNGSGKSTLLQLITGILTPTYGKIEVKGRVGALIELGSGFNPEFTGRENVFLNGCLLGLSNEEVERKFDQIAAFADIGSHLDRAVKTYSSGMMLRLAFAVQMAVEPEILIIDEALAVGDARFQLKCFKRLEELKLNGTTILFVSHSVDLVKSFCDKGLVLNTGHAIYWGDTKTAATKYYEILFPKDDALEEEKKNLDTIVEKIEQPQQDVDTTKFESKIIQKKSKANAKENLTTLELKRDDLKMSWGGGGALLNHACIKGLKHPNIMIRESHLIISLQIHLNYEMVNAIATKEGCLKNIFVGIRFDNYKGIPVFDIFHELTANEICLLEEKQICELDLEFEIEIPELCQGNYFVTFGIAIGTLGQVFPLYSSDNATMLTLELHNEILGQMRPKFRSKRMS